MLGDISYDKATLQSEGKVNKVFTFTFTFKWTRLENCRTLEFTNLPSISPQSDFLGLCFFRLVYKHAKFGDFFSWFSFQWHFSIEGNSPA